jgi:hypothetical protein
MNIQTNGSKRPKLYPPRALLSIWPGERRSPNLTGTELRRIVTEVLG